MPKRSNHEIMRTKLTPVLRPGEWGVFKARLTHALVRRTVRDSRFTRLTPAQLIALLREKLRAKPRPPPRRGPALGGTVSYIWTFSRVKATLRPDTL